MKRAAGSRMLGWAGAVALVLGVLLFDEKRAAQLAGKADAFVDSNACRDYAKAARAKLDERLARERATPP